MESSNILVVEDDGIAAKMIMDVLETEGYAVFSASTKSVAIELASRTKPSLVFINAILADASGLEIARAIREMEELKGIPLIMLTEMQEEFNERYKSTYGIVGFLKKPVDENDLLSKTRSLVPLEVEAEAGSDAGSDDVWESQGLDQADESELAVETIKRADEVVDPEASKRSDKIKIKVKVGEEADDMAPAEEAIPPEEFDIGAPVEEARHEATEEEVVPDESIKDEALTVNQDFADTGRHDEPSDQEPQVSSDGAGEEVEVHPLDRGFIDTGRHDEPEAEEPHTGVGEVRGEEYHTQDKRYIDSAGHEPVDEGEEEPVEPVGNSMKEATRDDPVEDERAARPSEIPQEEAFELPVAPKERRENAARVSALGEMSNGEAAVEDAGSPLTGAGVDRGALKETRSFLSTGSRKRIIIFSGVGVVLIAALTWMGLSLLGKVRDASERVSSDSPVQVATVKPQDEKGSVKGTRADQADVVSTVPSATGEVQGDKAEPVPPVTTKAGSEQEKIVTAKQDVQQVEPPKTVRKAASAPSVIYSVQIGFFRDLSNARNLRDKMAKKGYSVSVKKDMYKGGTVYRVLIGKYTSRKTASRMVDKIKRVERMDAALHKR